MFNRVLIGIGLAIVLSAGDCAPEASNVTPYLELPPDGLDGFPQGRYSFSNGAGVTVAESFKRIVKYSETNFDFDMELLDGTLNIRVVDKGKVTFTQTLKTLAGKPVSLRWNEVEQKFVTQPFGEASDH